MDECKKKSYSTHYHDWICRNTNGCTSNETWSKRLRIKTNNPDELLKKIIEALKVDTQQSLKNISLKENKAKVTIHQEYLEGESDAAKELYHYVKLVAPTPMSVLINGASGTGKEYIAHRIHQLSKRSDKPFIAIDCGAIPKELAASEFFGHIKGSFTGAIQ